MIAAVTARDEQIRDALRTRSPGAPAWTAPHEPAPVLPAALLAALLRNGDPGRRGAVVCVTEDDELTRLGGLWQSAEPALASALDRTVFEGVVCYVVQRDQHGVRVLTHNGILVHESR